GHAMEARLYAEDPERGFLPSTGRLRRLRLPDGLPDVRVDSGVEEGDEVTVHYDPMIAKVVAWGADRGAAVALLRKALERTDVEGPHTNARYLWEILGADAVRSGDVSTRLLEQALTPVGETPTERADAWLIAAASRVAPARTGSTVAQDGMSPWAGGAGFRLNGDATVRVALRLGDERHWLRLSRDGAIVTVSTADGDHSMRIIESTAGRLVGSLDGQPFAAGIEERPDAFVVRRQCLRFEFHEDTGALHHASAEHEGHLRAPMPGHVLDVRAVAGRRVAAGDVLVVLEAMKMEHALAAPWDGTVISVPVKSGDRVEEGVELVILEPLEEAPLRHTAAQE
ncbi:MAG TPA: hypothetical protein PK163_10750, partial [Steroidobacteraceae bacterium]|nr:hypothetical protein [Steroidobacteraceae bacterium]